MALNDGKGNFTYSERYLNAEDSGAYTYFPALGDLDGDGDLDLALGGRCGAQLSQPEGEIRPPYDLIWLNDGKGNFSDNGQRLGAGFGTGMLALGDLDNDGDLDNIDANTSSMSPGGSDAAGGQANLVWLNDGKGNFSDSGQRLGHEESNAVALGDLDGDGDLDAFVGNRGGPGVAEKWQGQLRR